MRCHTLIISHGNEHQGDVSFRDRDIKSIYRKRMKKIYLFWWDVCISQPEKTNENRGDGGKMGNSVIYIYIYI